MKKYNVIFMLVIVTLMLVGCDGQNKKTDDLVDVTYADMDTMYTKTYYDLLPTSLHNDDVVKEYSDVDIMDLASDMIGEISDGYEDNIPEIPEYESLEPSEINASELSDITFDTLHQNFGVIGPVEMVYSNLASVQYLLQLLEKMNQEFEKYGTIEFDGTEIIIPGTDFPKIQDPLTGDDFYFNDIIAQFTKEDKVSNILVHTVNEYQYDDVMGKFSGEVGLYLNVSISMNKDNETTISINFYVTCDLSLESNISNSTLNDTGSIHYQIGQSVKAIDNKSIVINNDIQSNINLELVNNDFAGTNIPDIDESISTKTSFILTKNNDGIVSDFKVSTNILDNAEFNYHLTADDDGAIVYIDGALSDAEFYGQNIPAQAIKGVFVYDNNNEIIFIGGDLALNIPEYDDDDNYTGTSPINYAAYAWNLNDLNGWTDIKITTNSKGDEDFILYNGDTVLLSAEDQQGTFKNDDEDDELIEGKAIVAGSILVEDNSYNTGIYVHIKQGDSINIELPEGLTSTHYDSITELFTNLTSVKDEMIIDFDNELYQVPDLQKDLFKEISDEGISNI